MRIGTHKRPSPYKKAACTCRRWDATEAGPPASGVDGPASGAVRPASGPRFGVAVISLRATASRSRLRGGGDVLSCGVGVWGVDSGFGVWSLGFGV
jgi:hypothetical protein